MSRELSLRTKTLLASTLTLTLVLPALALRLPLFEPGEHSPSMRRLVASGDRASARTFAYIMDRFRRNHQPDNGLVIGTVALDGASTEEPNFCGEVWHVGARAFAITTRERPQPRARLAAWGYAPTTLDLSDVAPGTAVADLGEVRLYPSHAAPGRVAGSCPLFSTGDRRVTLSLVAPGGGDRGGWSYQRGLERLRLEEFGLVGPVPSTCLRTAPLSARGTFAFDNVPPGLYQVTCSNWQPREVDVESGRTSQSEDPT